MIDWIILAVYIVGYLFSIRIALYEVAVMMDIDPAEDEIFDTGMLWFFALTVSVFWPLVLAAKIFYKLALMTGISTSDLMAIPKHVREERELEAREERIAELERENRYLDLEIKRLTRNDG